METALAARRLLADVAFHPEHLDGLLECCRAPQQQGEGEAPDPAEGADDEEGGGTKKRGRPYQAALLESLQRAARSSDVALAASALGSLPWIQERLAVQWRQHLRRASADTGRSGLLTDSGNQYLIC